MTMSLNAEYCLFTSAGYINTVELYSSLAWFRQLLLLLRWLYYPIKQVLGL